MEPFGSLANITGNISRFYLQKRIIDQRFCIAEHIGFQFGVGVRLENLVQNYFQMDTERSAQSIEQLQEVRCGDLIGQQLVGTMIGTAACDMCGGCSDLKLPEA